MTEIKLAYRNLKRDINVYILLIISSAIFVALIIGFQSTISTGDLGALLSADEMSDKRLLFKIVLWLIAIIQYLILYFFFNSYYQFINKIRVRELALYKVIGYSRKSIRKIVFTENMLVYTLISLISIILASGFNIIIVGFINYQMQLETKLSSGLSIKSMLISLLILLVLCVFNMYRTYKKAIKVDIDVALSDNVQQQKIILKPKRYIISSFILGLLLLANMTYLSMTVTMSIKFGIIIIAVFYGFGLFLIVNAITKGYQYLVSDKYKNKSFNLLLTSEINYHLNKSKFILLSSIIFMMLSIGALLLSQIITDMLSKSTGEFDYVIQDYYLESMDTYNGKWSITSEDGYDLQTNIYYTETRKQELDDLGVDITENTLLASPAAADDYNLTEGEIVTYSYEGSDVEFKTKIIDDVDDNILYLTPYMSFTDNMNNPVFSNEKKLYGRLQILQREVAKGNVSQVYINKLLYFVDGMDYSWDIVSNSNFNDYLEMIGEKPISLENNQVWIDGFNSEESSNLDVIGQSYTGVNAIIVSDVFFQDYEKKLIAPAYETINPNSITLFKAKNKTELVRIDQELKAVSDWHNGIIINSLNKSEALGSSAFILLIAFYIAIIFIICNFTLLAINLLSHGIENKSVYLKLDEMGISKSQKEKYISVFIRSFYVIPLIIGISSGLIATNFAMNILELNKVFKFTNISLIIYVLVLYITSYIIFINITKYIYKRIINERM